MEALVKACEDENYPAEITVVLSNNPAAKGLEFAQGKGIATEAINHKEYDTRDDFEKAISKALEPYDLDVVCLAGFMRILTPRFLCQWPERIINIHPSLLPKHKGLNTHARVLEAGDEETGCSVHYAVPDMDSGEILVQRSVPVLDGDTEETLAERVLEQEHVAYPAGLKIVADKLIEEMQ